MSQAYSIYRLQQQRFIKNVNRVYIAMQQRHLPCSDEKLEIGNIEEQLFVVQNVRMWETVDVYNDKV